MRVLALFIVVYATDCADNSVCDATACKCVADDDCKATTHFCLKGSPNVMTELTDDKILKKGAVADGSMFCVQGNFEGKLVNNTKGMKVAKCKKDSYCNPNGTKTDDEGETKEHLCLKKDKVLNPGMKAEDGDKICIGMIAGKCAKDTFCNPSGNETNAAGDKITHLCLKADKVLGLGKSDNTTAKFCIGKTTAAECAKETRCNPHGNITEADGATENHVCVNEAQGRLNLGGGICITQVITLKCGPNTFCNKYGNDTGDGTAITNVCIRGDNFLPNGEAVEEEKKICVGKTNASKCETTKKWCDHEFASGCVKQDPNRCNSTELNANLTAEGSTDAQKKANCSKAECIYQKVGETESCEKPTCGLSRKVLEDGVCNGTSHQFNAAKNAIMCDGNCTKELCCAAVSSTDETANAVAVESAIWGTELEIYVIIGCFCALFLVAAILFLGSFLASSTRDASGKIQYHTPTPAYLKQRTREAWSNAQARFTSVRDFATQKRDRAEKTPMLPKPLPQAQVKNPNEKLGLTEFVQQSRKQMQKQKYKGAKNNNNQTGKEQQDRNVTWKRKAQLDSKGRNTKAEGTIRLRSESQNSGRKSKNSAGKYSAIAKGSKGSKHSAGSNSTKKYAEVSKYTVGTTEWAVALSSAKKSIREAKNAAKKSDKKTSVRKNTKDASSSKESKHASNRKNVKGKSNRLTEKKNFSYKV